MVCTFSTVDLSVADYDVESRTQKISRKRWWDVSREDQRRRGPEVEEVGKGDKNAKPHARGCGYNKIRLEMSTLLAHDM